ncbi:hypothetical protein AB0M20_42185, partial [Actinoplanes sp. NPDC051633]|uniref:hypothetical protein n=1 Tax=Actinoplanes sp. NPDC051633 TaxID=3155670 RepID=UPI00343F5865
MKFPAISPARLALVALVAAAVPFAGIASAEASTTNWGCTVDPERPVFDHINPANGDKVIRYNMTVTCAAGREVTIEQHIHEEDGPNDYTHQTQNTRSRHFSADDTVTMYWDLTLRNNDISSAEEMYHTV